VTLVEGGLALFPDAHSERARRHLDTLSGVGGAGRAGVLFLVQGQAERFLPDVHNDLDFARAFAAVSGRVDFFACALEPAIGCDGRLRFVGRPRPLAIPWDALEAGSADGGLYLLLLHLARGTRLEAGVLGWCDFAAGWYVYAGSARRNLSQRLARHLRLAKRRHWHVDALREAADQVRALPIRGTRGCECELAAAVRAIADASLPRFGSSDCRCPGHLFRFDADPLHTAGFQRLLTEWRHRI
jgi:sugar fermentation stimulation protein A